MVLLEGKMGGVCLFLQFRCKVFARGLFLNRKSMTNEGNYVRKSDDEAWEYARF